MVRETRHLWVGNLPDNIREDRIREHFKRYGRVQNVKLLGRTETPGGSTNMPAGASGVCATVAFMDIKSASKAHNVEHVLDERTLTTEYYEPAAIPAGVASAGSSPAGSGYSGSSSSVNSAPAPLPAATVAAAASAASTANPTASTAATRYHLSGSEEVSPTCALAATAAAPANWRGTNDSASDYCRRGSTPAAYGRYARNTTAPYATPPTNVDRSTPHHRWYSSAERGATGGESTPSTPGGGTDSGRRRRRSGSGSSRSDSSSPEPSDNSRASTPAALGNALHPARTPPSHHQWSSTASGRPLAICVRNLPTRSTDSSLKDGLYHEYKKHGKVVWVKVVGQNADRYAVVRFKKPSDVEKALEVSQDKLFFGCKISVAPHQSCDEDADSAKPYETDIDEYHPKATRTLFIGNLEKDVTQQQLRDKFKHFGRIIEIDIKKGSGGGAGYAFCQYAAISSVVEAIRSMDGEYVGGSRVKLGFGKPVATTCVWVDGLTETTEKQVLACVARCGAATSVCVDRAAGAALVHFEQAGAAGAAVRELRRVAAHASAAEPERPRLAVDYASRECQDAFYEQLEKHGGAAALAQPDRLPTDPPAAPTTTTARYPAVTPRHDTLRYDSGGSRSRASSYGRSSSRTPRYSALEHYDPADYAADRRYRVYDELGNTSQPEEIALYEDRLPSVITSSPHRSRKHRRDSSPEDRKHSKERHRSVTISGVRRSRSGSCGGGERHAGRRRHRRRCEGSSSRGSRGSRAGSRAGTPLRDEPDAAPCEPRRAPRERPPRPLSLPLPRFALQILRAAPATPRPAPTAAPDSPPRPRSASSSSAGSAPHSPSIEERIRSLDEKLSGTRGAPELPDRPRFRNRLFELPINEVKPSEVVRSLLAKRSVFDEDSERLESVVRPPSPGSSPRSRPPPAVPRALRYPFPVHPPPAASLPSAASTSPAPHLSDIDQTDRPADPRLNRPDRPYVLERLGKFNESDYKVETRVRLRTPSIDRVHSDLADRWQSPRAEGVDHEKDQKKSNELVRRNSVNSIREDWKERRLSIESDSLPKRADSIHSIQDAQVKKERQLSIEFDSGVKRRDSVQSVGEAQIKKERRSSTEGESVNKRRNSVAMFREAQIKIERLLSVETDSRPDVILSNNGQNMSEESTSETKTQDSVSVDLETQNSDERQSPVESELKRTSLTLHVNRETEAKNDRLLSLEAEERAIKEAIEKIDPDNKDIQTLIHDDKVLQQNKAELSHNNNPTLLNEHVDPVDRLEEHQDTCMSKTLESNTRILEQSTEKQLPNNDMNVECGTAPDLKKDRVVKCNSANLAQIKVTSENETELCKDILIQNHINKELLEFEMQHGHINSLNSMKPNIHISELGHGLLKNNEKNGKERFNQNVILEAFHIRLEKENIQFDKQKSKDMCPSITFPNDKKASDTDKNTEDRGRSDRDKVKHSKDRAEKDKHDSEKDKTKSLRHDRVNSERKCKEDSGIEKLHHEKKIEKEHEKQKDKADKDKSRHNDDKKSRNDHHRKERNEREDDKRREKRKEDDNDMSKAKKEEKHKYERSKKEPDSKRDSKKDDTKSRKSSRDETTRDLYRKDSTDSSTSRASHESSKVKEVDLPDIKEEPKPKHKLFNDLFTKLESGKELTSKVLVEKVEAQVKIKTEMKEEKDSITKHNKHKIDNSIENPSKCKIEITEKLRHYSLDSPSLDCKRKERLNSCSSLPSSLGQKRRISSQDGVDLVLEDVKKNKPAIKTPERRDSKESRSCERPKTAKFNKGHFAKIIEGKTKDDKKNQVKPPDESSLPLDLNHQKSLNSNAQDQDKIVTNNAQPEGLQNHLDFLATLELRSSEEDERQKALRNEMKEKKRIQQLQQIQELQMQQDALQHAELIAKLKDEKKKCDDKKKEAARDKRMSTERKSREEKSDSGKRKNRKQLSTDSSDSDEPKKNHSIFDVVDDEPAYISMYDKVKARSCKNMQKQEEEKRQEKIKAKFSQLKQSRAKREEKKRSSWDEDSDSEHERTKPHKSSVDSSTDDDHFSHDKKCGKLHRAAFEFDRNKINDYFSTPSNEDDSRNKLSRKNSRSRIISDTSDDDGSKRSFSKSPSFFNDIRKEFMTDYESMQRIRDEMSTKDSSEKVKKNSLLNLFGKSDSDDSKIKSGFESSDKSGFSKTMSNDCSSEGENVTCNRIRNEIRKKHKKKLKKHKFSFSDDDSKLGKNELNLEVISRLENRSHCPKNDKRRDKAPYSTDGDDNRDEKTKSKREKKIASFDIIESNINNKKDGKMEDIFGPLSDDSDRDLPHNDNVDSRRDFDSTFGNSQMGTATNNEENKNKEGMKQKKDKKRKEKRPMFMKEDDNSLDVDAVSKAIEARLFADNDDDAQEHNKTDSSIQNNSNSIYNNLKYVDNQYSDTTKLNRHIDKVKRDCKKKKKKKNREDRQNRREHHYHFNHHHEKKQESISIKSMLLDIPLPSDDHKVESVESVDKKLASESPSLPRLTDSPPIGLLFSETDTKNRDSDATDCSGGDHNMDVEYVGMKTIEVNEIPMPPPLENIVKDISEVPLPSDPVPDNEDQRKRDAFLPTLCRAIDVSEDAVRSITNFEKESNKPTDKTDNLSPKADKKIDEKPRAVISQEETADAVAALLGESFGEKDDAFANYEEVDDDASHQIEIECSTTVNENIPEEDAEEMRQAVQNLNACEMEMKPDTPVSDNDHLLIDTDTEEADDPVQDNAGRLPVKVITTAEIPTLPQKSLLVQNLVTKDSSSKIVEPDNKIHLPKRDQVSSTAIPVITSLTLTNNKSLEPHITNIKTTQLSSRENDVKPTHITANIVQIRAPQNHVGATLRPIITSNRGTTPYQVVNHVIRPQAALNMQPPTIKIPDPHILYQRPQSIVISPRMIMDPRQQSPKGSPQGESMSSPRLSNVAFLSTSPQNINSVGLTTATSIQQRSPGQVTVVRMQQPPLSPIQAIHLPAGTRTMVSPNRPNSVLVQTQGTPIHLNRLPVTPVLAPISKPITGNILQQNKVTGSGNPSLFHQQKITVGDCRRTDHRIGNDNDTSKIILSSTSLQHSTNPTVMAQNRLISMQNAIHTGNIHLNNKIVTNNVSHLNEKRDSGILKSDQQNHVSYSTAPIIRIAGANHSTASIIQSGSKPIMSTIQDPNPLNRGQGSNVIHTLNSQRLLTTSVPTSNIIQIDAKNAPSVLSMATIKPQTVLTKSELPNSVAVTCNSQTNIVMAPLLLKTSTTPVPLRPPSNMKNENVTETQLHDKQNDLEKTSSVIFDRYPSDTLKESTSKPAKTLTLSQESIAKCETDFEELLKDNTNEIKITHHPDKKLEINVGNTITNFPTNILKGDRTLSKDTLKKAAEDQIDNKGNVNLIVSDNKSTAARAEQDITVELSDKNDLNAKERTSLEKSKDRTGLEKLSLQSSLDVLSGGPKNDVEPIFREGMLNQSNSQIKSLDENDSWSAKDVNIESVIKKVDSLCNENETDTDKSDDTNDLAMKDPSVAKPNTDDLNLKDVLKPMDIETETDAIGNSEETTNRNAVTSKRGGRGIRGKKAEKNRERVQTRQIGKPSRGGASAKRGRGRAKVDKKIQNLINNSVNNLPGDVYDFHEDSGDETSASLNKNESRPRLILTIKSPVTVNPIATAPLSITAKEETSPKDQLIIHEKSEKEDKTEDFMSPSANTRKSRRLQEKDVQRTTVDDVIDDVVKGSSVKSPAKDNNKKRPTRQTGIKVCQTEKTSASDTRKSPRGMKRTRDRSLSDVSVDSNSCPADSIEEKTSRKDELPKPIEAKIPKLVEPPVTSKSEPDPPQPTKNIINSPGIIPPVVPTTSSTTSTPIMKPPKKMISEISAKLASVFEAAASVAPARQPAPAEAEKLAPIPREIRNPEFVMGTPAASELMAAATGDARVGSEMAFASVGEAALARRLDAAGAAEAGDARVQSPALPHRPPDAHRPPDRATPLLIRGGDSEGVSLGVGVGVGAGAGACGAGPPRAYAGPASLPRGAHHPPAPPHTAALPALPSLPTNIHHPGAASRVSITSIPSISPQGQIGLSAELIRSPPPAHQQTSPVSGEGMYPHFSHQHYQMYQQHFRATQHENRANPPYTRPLEAEGCEAPAPPLELRRPPSARVPRPAHSPSPADRLIMYAAGCGRSPPPAHGVSRLPGALPPLAAPGPPHASQVPREADSLQMLLQRYPVMWQGLLALKNDSAAVQMHFVGGNMAVAGDTLPRHTDGSTPPLRIAQRMRLEPAQLDQVHRKMKLENEHCMLLALPCGRDHMDVLQQSTNLTAGFITYLQRKQAAGIVNVAPPGHLQAMYTVHIFPSCDFANENLNRIAPDLMHRVADIAHLLIVIATV